VNNKQGFPPINGIWSEDESRISPALFPEQRISEPIEQKFRFDGNTLVKTILFVCNECEGPLAPSSSCLVCKRTAQRKCTKCGNKVPNGSHLACEYLALLGTLRSNKLDRKKKKEVDL
jgi:hypothetical protein